MVLATREVVELVDLGSGRWVLDLGRGVGLEIVLLFSRTIAFWRIGGELVLEAVVGES
jgi:hypothetical protein